MQSSKKCMPTYLFCFEVEGGGGWMGPQLNSGLETRSPITVRENGGVAVVKWLARPSHAQRISSSELPLARS